MGNPNLQYIVSQDTATPEFSGWAIQICKKFGKDSQDIATLSFSAISVTLRPGRQCCFTENGAPITNYTGPPLQEKGSAINIRDTRLIQIYRTVTANCKLENR